MVDTVSSAYFSNSPILSGMSVTSLFASLIRASTDRFNHILLSLVSAITDDRACAVGCSINLLANIFSMASCHQTSRIRPILGSEAISIALAVSTFKARRANAAFRMDGGSSRRQR
ncbi:hypothetical protein V8G54_030519 [Vigna mungo]|uniref:Uncharacterized protein n=1 Tax=Vigna mungo TaxID=3915 RepID=A0AAQ3RMY0_VIGMU